ncbi:dynactin 25 kDa subunit [Heterostelium album PN500]|uniref:Dynactin subunit 5 n=1 Tax=Heterostelium pallidum (strain ATCC 26659 / Pp 5 / PN500) TaxID=670386 RepID=D3B6E4_HETP5|nr:dynactin 25 kDa subunit [Heterostelium album PN500]EFA82914.1 dynactin 25 kDa subunit [Heterostelium album PN500]|eukprot:XP_020435031.1 dynactin 25 kDa subunit [Heterostelium album PN500]
MQQQPTYFDKSEYIETLNGNKVSKKSILCGIMNIRLHGKTIIKPGVLVRGDLANVNIGRLSIVEENTVIRPSYKKFKGSIAYFPLNIGDHVIIKEDTVISAATIGSYSKRCILKDCCMIPDNTILPPDTVVPPFTIYQGFPGTMKEELPDCFEQYMKDLTTNCYDSFIGQSATSSTSSPSVSTPVKQVPSSPISTTPTPQGQD